MNGEQAADRTETLLPKTIEMLNDLGHDLEIFQIYETIFTTNTPMSDDLMDIFVDIIVFWTEAIHFFRRNKYGRIRRLCITDPSLFIQERQLLMHGHMSSINLRRHRNGSKSAPNGSKRKRRL